MGLDIKELLEREVDHIKEKVDQHEPAIDELIELEKEGSQRSELLDWLEQKRERLRLLESEEHIEELLSHIEWAYNTASISAGTYAKAKEINTRLLENN